MIHYIIKDMTAVFRYMPYGIVAGIFAAIVFSAINDVRIKKGKEPIPIMSATCFYMYLVIILFITFLSRESGVRSGMDLELFSTWGINKRNNAYVVENILLFIPYGFVCAWARKSARRFPVCVMYGFVTSTLIEFLQLITGRGYFQVDDILTNVLGTIIGYILFRSIMREENTKQAKRAYVYLTIFMLLAMIMGIIVYDGTDNSIIHATAYGAMTVVISCAFQMKNGKRRKRYNFIMSVIICIIIALIDEGAQKYIFDSDGRLWDVALDIIMTAVGGLVYLIFSKLIQMFRKE